MMNLKISLSFGTLLLVLTTSTHADWRTAKIKDIYFGYDGQTTSFTLIGSSKTNCTCYSTWPDRFCLNRARTSYKDEMATMLMAKSTGQNISVNVDENTCMVVALGIE